MPIATAFRKSPLYLPGAFFLLCALLFFINRIALYFFYNDSFSDIEKRLLIFPVGLRMDTIILCQSLVIPVLLAIFIDPQKPLVRKLLQSWYSLIACLFVFMEISTWPFIAEFGSRPNQLFFVYFTHPAEVIGTIWAEQKFLSLISLVLLALGWTLTWKFVGTQIRENKTSSFKARLAWFPVAVVLLLLGARSGIGEAVANPSLAAFSSNHTANQLALNSTYSLVYSIYLQNSDNAMRMSKLYGEMPDDEVISRVLKQSHIKTGDASIPTLHVQESILPTSTPRNLVIILMESMGADFVGHLGGPPVTPHLDDLAKQGIHFTQLYAIGQRTHRGMEALTSGYLPTSKGSSIMRLDLAQKDFFTIGQLLKRKGYQSSFIYNGESHFDGMSGFLLGNGFDDVLDVKDFEDPIFEGTWGVSDEDLFNKANDYFRNLQPPFVSVILTLSNHSPYEFPDGRITLHEEPKATELNAAKYADHALGQFFNSARKERYFDNTVFILVADHPMRIRSEGLVPVENYRIPGIILGPGITPQVINQVSSQIDLLPTALPLLGEDYMHPMIGRSWLTKSYESGQANMFYDQSHAYRQDNRVIIHQPNKEAMQFDLKNGMLIRTGIDEELRKDALAHILFPGIAYRKQLYHLPDEKLNENTETDR